MTDDANAAHGTQDSPAAGTDPSPAAGEPAAEGRKLRTLDARSLRGLAHPLRMELLGLLRHDGPATASQLAGLVGESSGSTSYHLRQLAEHGFVEDVPGRGRGRERWWRAAEDGTRFDDTLLTDENPAVRGAANLFIQEVAATHARELANWVGSNESWPHEWRRVSNVSDYTLRLTTEQAEELAGKLDALIESYRVPDADAPADSEQLRLHVHAFPRTQPPAPAQRAEGHEGAEGGKA